MRTADDDQDRRPGARKAKQRKDNGAPILLLLVVGAIVMAFLCVIGVGGAAFFWLRPKGPEAQAKRAPLDPVNDGKPRKMKLTEAHFKFAWRRDLDRHVLSFNHGQPDNLTNVEITIHWFQAGYKSNASQRLHFPVWRANEFKQQVMGMRGRPTAIRIVGDAEGPNATRFEIDCPIPDPR